MVLLFYRWTNLQELAAFALRELMLRLCEDLELWRRVRPFGCPVLRWPYRVWRPCKGGRD